MTMRAAIVAGLLLLGSVPAPAKPKGPPCADGRYLLPTPLVAGQAGSPAEAIEAGASRVAIGTACGGVAPKRFRAVAGGTKVKAAWQACAGLTGKVTLAGTIAEGCTLLRGKVKAKRFRKSVEARLSTCGDGRVDAGGGERCDPPSVTCDTRCQRIARETIGAAGGRIASDDGRLTLDVPAGALPADTTLTIRALTVAEAAALGGELGWDLGPDGTRFGTPVTATLTLPGSPLADDGGSLGSALFALFTANAAGDPELPPEQRLVLDGSQNVATLSVALAHFTPLLFRPVDPGERDQAFTRVTFAPGTTLRPGAPFTPTVEFQLRSERLNEQGVIYIDQTAPGDIIVYTGAAEVELGKVGGGKTRVAAPVTGYACGPKEGIGEYRARVEVRSAGAIFGIGAQTSLVTQLVALIKCEVPRRTTTTTTSTTSTSTSTRTQPTAATTSITSTTVAIATTSSSTRITTTTSTTRTTTTTTSTLLQVNCCDCPSPRGCASGPAVKPADCTDFGCKFVAGAMCTPAGDCAAPTTSSTSTSTSSSSSSSSSSSTTTSTDPPAPSTTTSTLPSVSSVLVKGPEGLWISDPLLFGTIGQGRLVVIVAGLNGWAFVDAFTGEALEATYLSPVGPVLFVATPLGAYQPGPVSAAASGGAPDLQGVIQAGPSGPAITLYDGATEDFGFTQVFPGNPPCFDAVPYGGDPLSGGVVLACGARLQTLEPNATFAFFTQGPLHTGFPQTNFMPSAFRRRAGGPIVALTDGKPGKIWKHPATGVPGTTPQEVGPAGDNPRRIRCAGPVCAVSNFGSDSLTVLTWNAQDAVAIVGTVPVGDGPVGIDIRARLDGNFEVLSTGLNDSSWSVTVLRPNGSTVSNQKRAAPTGCVRPGHVVWASGRRAVMTCNGSDAIAVVQVP